MVNLPRLPALFLLLLALCLLAAAPAGATDADAPAAKNATTKKAAAPPRWLSYSESEIDAMLDRAQSMDFDERIVFLSTPFVNTPYRLGPLGEGETGTWDTDPVFSLESVDCLTFLEQLWGMLNAHNLSEARTRTQWLRYEGGRIEYRLRHHFTWSQWLPANVARGFVADITCAVGGEACVRQTKKMGARYCGGKWKEFCEQLGEHMPTGESSRELLPLDWARAHVSKIPHGSFLFVVLTDRVALPYRIKHAGLVLHPAGQPPILRHASSHHRKVVDVPLGRYLKMLKEKTEQWPAEGVILVRPTPPPPHSVDEPK